MIKTFEENSRYKLQTETGEAGGEGFIFLHLTVKIWNKTVLKELRLLLDEVIALADAEGYDRVSFYIKKTQGVKFHELIKPLHYKKAFGPNNQYLVGGWWTREI